jgi:hypothetical protein
MSTTVSDVSGNRIYKIVNAAKVLGGSPQRIELFLKIYSGKKVKSVSDLMSLTGYTHVRVLQIAKGLASEDIILQIKTKGEGTSYKKIDFYNNHRKKIVQLATNKSKLEKFSRQHHQVHENIYGDKFENISNSKIINRSTVKKKKTVKRKPRKS